jgi:hypothetical protein
MSDKVKIFAFCLAVFSLTAIAFMGLGGLIGYQHGLASCPQCPEIASDTVTFSDTTNISGSDDRPDADSLISADRIPYPVPYPIYLPGDTICEHDTFYVYLPYEHRLYSVPDTLDVWYSGIEPCIDSAKVYNHTTTITNTIVNTEYKMPRLTADIGAGALYSGNNVNPYLVGEVRYNCPKTTFSAFGAINHEGGWCAGGNVTYRINIIK